MLEILFTNQHEVKISYLLNAVSDNAPRTSATLYEVEFKLLMFVNRIGKAILVTLYDIETVLFRKRRNFIKYIRHGYRFSEMQR